MANVRYQSNRPAAPNPETLIKTSGDDITGHVQHVALSDVAGMPLVETRVQTGVRALTVSIGPTDPISDIPVVMEFDHHQLHEGETWRWSVYVGSIASGVSKDIQLVVPNTVITTSTIIQMPHLRFQFLSPLGGRCFLYEGPTVSADGTARTPINLERNGTYTPDLIIYEDPVVDAVGTQIWQGVLYASRQSTGALDEPEQEFVLKNNTRYLIRFTSAANSNEILIRLVWYEDKGV